MRKKFPVFIVMFCLLLSAVTIRANIVVLNGLTHENEAEPGQTYRGTIQIQNVGASVKSVKIYVRDYWYSYTGESKHDAGGTLPRSNAEWITFNPELLALDSNEVAAIDFEVKIPDDDTLRGSYWSVLMVEGINEPDTTRHEEGVQINTAIRYAVQIISNVGNDAKSDLNFLGFNLEKKAEANVLHVAVENTGEQILRPEMSLELFDELGNSLGVIRAERRKTLPGTSIKSTLLLKDIAKGKYSGVLVADCGEDRLYGTNLAVEIE